MMATGQLQRPSMQAGKGKRDAEWAKLQPLVKSLYMDQGKTLKEIMEIMERQHSFVAS